MTINRIDANTKQNLKIAGVSALGATTLTAVNMLANNITPKDIFQYKNLKAVQKQTFKTSVIGGIFCGVLMAIASKYFTNSNKDKF